MIDNRQCPEFPYFGETYPDACCIDGMLWDLDSDEDGSLTKGGDVPCPFCNSDGFVEHHADGENTQDILRWIDSIKENHKNKSA